MQDNRGKSKYKHLMELTVAYGGALAGAVFVSLFNQNVLGNLSSILRLPCMMILYWFIALIPGIVMKLSEDKLNNYGFTGNRIGKQIVSGIIASLVMSFLFTFLPHIIGMGNYVDNGSRYRYFWQYLFEFAYCIVSVSAVEEFVFRGVLYYKIKKIGGREWIAIVFSSALFGLFHIFQGNLIQIVMTGLLGIVFCLLRLKIRGFTTLSLIFAHGIYDALISVWASIL